VRVAVIGAGMSGLGAARTLNRAGVETVVFEKSRGVGGRVATRRIGEFAFDHGATVISPRGSDLERVMTEELDTSELVLVEKPIYLALETGVSAVDAEGGKIRRYAYRRGNTTLGKLLASDLDVRLGSRVERIENRGDAFVVFDEEFSHVVVSAPFPQSQELLAEVDGDRRFNGGQYRMCLSLMYGVGEDIDRPFHALLEPDQAQPLTWLSLEHMKVPGVDRAPAGQSALVVQMSARYSRYSFDREDSAILEESWVDVRRLLKLKPGVPEVGEVKRWRYSHASNTLSFEAANPAGSRILVVGDGISGARTHQAYLVGVQAAKRILEERI
jgi:hypothetical protein